MKALKLTLSLMIFSGLIITGCGEKGDTGQPGPPGQSGPPGNANVLTINYTINTNQWTAISPSIGPGDEGYYLYNLINIPDITQEIIDYGAVLGYYEDNGFYLPLPTNKL